MKKQVLISFIATLICMTLITSCGSSFSTPSSVNDSTVSVASAVPDTSETESKTAAQASSSAAVQETIEETIADYYALKMGDTQMALEKNRSRAVFLGIMAVIFAVIVFASSRFSGGVLSVVVEVVFILFWVFVWELTDCLLFDRRDLLESRTEAAQLASVKVTFKEQFEDEPVKPSEEKAIIREIFEDDVILPSDEW